MMSSYKVLNQNEYNVGEYRIVPIRLEDRFDIMKWRNEQMYHLRQNKQLSIEDQDKYFDEVVSKLFEQEKPNQILFSYLEGRKCIGYGGLVHINWVDKNAEISFIMATHLEQEFFEFHWNIYLRLIIKVAFNELNLHKIFTYAFDIRPHLYEAIESAGFVKEAVLKEHCYCGEEYKDVVIHSIVNSNDFTYRPIRLLDKDLIYEWNSNEQTRLNSFNSNKISKETHDTWFSKKTEDKNAFYLIVLNKEVPIALVRYDISEQETTVGINLSEKYRGKGFSAKILIETSELYFSKFDKPIFAWIKPSNIASIKSFERAKYVFEREEKVMNLKALVFKLSKKN